MPRTRRAASVIDMRASLAVVLALVGCGDNRKPAAPDAPPPDADTCTPVGLGALDFTGSNPSSLVLWSAPVTGDVGDGQPITLELQFYGGIEDHLTGTFDLAAGNQANFETCAICFVGSEHDADGNVTKWFFQKSGTVTLSEDPLTNEHLVAAITGLELQEVDVDTQHHFHSTPVANGACARLGDLTVDRDHVPNAFTCSHDRWLDGATCDCMCGLQDPDCFKPGNPIEGCTNELCFAAQCQAPPANDTCQTAAALTLGTPVTGTTIGAFSNYNAGLEGTGCTGYTQSGGDVVYAVDLAANIAYQIALTNVDAGFDASVALVGPGDASICDATPITTCVAGWDTATEGGDEIFTFAPASSGTYFVIVDSYVAPGLEAGAFTLAVTAM